MLLDDAALPGLFASLDAAMQAAAASLTVAPPAIAVEVDNGTTRAGLARQVGTALAGVGFRVGQVRTVAAALPGSRLAPGASLPSAGLVVTVGTSYRGVRKVTVSARGPSAVRSTAAASPPPRSQPRYVALVSLLPTTAYASTRPSRTTSSTPKPPADPWNRSPSRRAGVASGQRPTGLTPSAASRPRMATASFAGASGQARTGAVG